MTAISLLLLIGVWNLQPLLLAKENYRNDNAPSLYSFKSESDLRSFFKMIEGDFNHIDIVLRKPTDKSVICVIDKRVGGDTTYTVFAYKETSPGYRLFLRYDCGGVGGASVTFSDQDVLNIWVEQYTIIPVKNEQDRMTIGFKKMKACSMFIPPIKNFENYKNL